MVIAPGSTLQVLLLNQLEPGHLSLSHSLPFLRHQGLSQVASLSCQMGTSFHWCFADLSPQNLQGAEPASWNDPQFPPLNSVATQQPRSCYRLPDGLLCHRLLWFSQIHRDATSACVVRLATSRFLATPSMPSCPRLRQSVFPVKSLLPTSTWQVPGLPPFQLALKNESLIFCALEFMGLFHPLLPGSTP